MEVSSSIYNRTFFTISNKQPKICVQDISEAFSYLSLVVFLSLCLSSILICGFLFFPPFGLILIFALQTRDPPILPPFSAIFEGNTISTGCRITCCLSYNFIERKELRDFRQEPHILSLDGMFECDWYDPNKFSTNKWFCFSSPCFYTIYMFSYWIYSLMK